MLHFITALSVIWFIINYLFDQERAVFSRGRKHEDDDDVFIILPNQAVQEWRVFCDIRVSLDSNRLDLTPRRFSFLSGVNQRHQIKLGWKIPTKKKASSANNFRATSRDEKRKPLHSN